jgi:hypothetical protein
MLLDVCPMQASTLQTAPLHPSAMATLSHRGAKPGERVELLISVRGVIHPVLGPLKAFPQLRIRFLRNPQFLQTSAGGVWLFRYVVTPLKVGDFELPPVRVTDGAFSTETKPVSLHVSENGDMPPLSPKELSMAVDIPESLSAEVINAVPRPAMKPSPAPTPRDQRPLSVRFASTCWKELKAFWNYPGK